MATQTPEKTLFSCLGIESFLGSNFLVSNSNNFFPVPFDKKLNFTSLGTHINEKIFLNILPDSENYEKQGFFQNGPDASDRASEHCGRSRYLGYFHSYPLMRL